MTTSEVIEALENLTKALSHMNFPYKDSFEITTQMILSGLRKPCPDESVVTDALRHIEQAKRLVGVQS